MGIGHGRQGDGGRRNGWENAGVNHVHSFQAERSSQKIRADFFFPGYRSHRQTATAMKTPPWRTNLQHGPDGHKARLPSVAAELGERRTNDPASSRVDSSEQGNSPDPVRVGI